MMHFWAQSYARSSMVSQSAAISLAAHVAIGGAAVYGTRHAALAAEVRRNERVVYHAPPDRQPGQRSATEMLQFVDVGAGVRLDGIVAPGGVQRGNPAEAKDARADSPGRDFRSQDPQTAIASRDSVYSILMVDETAARMEGSAAPIYPAELMRANIEGAVMVRYVIDSTGHAEANSLQVLSSSHPLFVQAVRDALPGMRFTAAMLDGRPVRELVEQSFAFQLNPPTVAPPEHTRTKPVP
jgi:TonB family protein